MKSETYPLLALVGFLFLIIILWVGIVPTRLPATSTEISRPIAVKQEVENSSPALGTSSDIVRVPLTEHKHLLPEYMAMAQPISWEEKQYDSYVVDTRVMELSFHWKDKRGKAYANFSNLESHFLKQDRQLLFAMNAGAFLPTPKELPIGLYVEKGRVKTQLNLEDGVGNFFKKPNGVFFMGEKGVGIIESTQYPRLTEKIHFATQSGPILVYRGNIHPDLEPESDNRYIRSGVGLIAPEELVFVISSTPVNFFEFADLFKRYFKCEMALYLDGGHSDMYMPELGRFSSNQQQLGPMVAISRPLK